MARSPIEMMVDQACGFDQSVQRPAPKPRVMLRCPKCGRKQKAALDDMDPPGTATVIIQCPKCCGGDFDSPLYEDANGKELVWKPKEA